MFQKISLSTHIPAVFHIEFIPVKRTNYISQSIYISICQIPPACGHFQANAKTASLCLPIQIFFPLISVTAILLSAKSSSLIWSAILCQVYFFSDISKEIQFYKGIVFYKAPLLFPELFCEAYQYFFFYRRHKNCIPVCFMIPAILQILQQFIFCIFFQPFIKSISFVQIHFVEDG